MTIVTPFAQLLASLWYFSGQQQTDFNNLDLWFEYRNVRSNLIAIANLSPEDKTRAASGGKRVTFTLNTQPLSDDAFQCAKVHFVLFIFVPKLLQFI